MKIGVDVDGVLTDLEAYQLKYGKKYFKDVSNIDETAYDICDIFHCSREEREKFWTKYIWGYSLTDSPRQDAKSVIQQLKKDGHEIYILTGRAHTTEDNVRGALFRKMLEYWLEKNGLSYDGIYYCSEDQSSTEKYDLCRQLGIDIMIEDKADNINLIKDIADVVCIRTGYNQDVVDEEHVHVTTNLWDAYKEIQKIANPKTFIPLKTEDRLHLTTEEREKYFDDMKEFYLSLPYDDEFESKMEKNYVRALHLGMPFFNLLYQPKVIHPEKVPEGNGYIFVANHLGSLDQFPIMTAIGDRPTHFLASTTLLPLKRGVLYKNTGAIFVDRQDSSSRENSKEKMGQYLLKGSNVFLFPEGTRNYMREHHIDDLYSLYTLANRDMSKEEFTEMVLKQPHLVSQGEVLKKLYQEGKISSYDFAQGLTNIDGFLREYLPFDEYVDSWMLPFKLGAVALAQSTGAPIVPFAVNNHYKVGEQGLLVRVGDTMSVGASDDLVEKNQELREQIASMIADNIQEEDRYTKIKK